jgi:hypothetical protein
MSWKAPNRSKDAKTPSVAGVRSQKPELDCCPVQPYIENYKQKETRTSKTGLAYRVASRRSPAV